MHNKTYYIAGPMRGYENFNFQSFDACAAEMREWEHHVISPAEHDREIGFDETANTLEGFDLASSLLWDMEQIAIHSDGIVLLPGWEKSSGCAAELALARALGRTVYEYEPDPEKRDRVTRYMLNPLKSDVKPSSEHTIDVRTYAGQLVATVTEAGEVRVTDPETGGQKGQKLARFDLIPAGALWQLAEHYGRGAQKYDDDNWRRGYSWRLSFAALMRHAWAFWRGEDIDPETGSPHMVAVAWHAFTLLTFASEGLGTDDRQSRAQEVAE